MFAGASEWKENRVRMNEWIGGKASNTIQNRQQFFIARIHAYHTSNQVFSMKQYSERDTNANAAVFCYFSHAVCIMLLLQFFSTSLEESATNCSLYGMHAHIYSTKLSVYFQRNEIFHFGRYVRASTNIVCQATMRDWAEKNRPNHQPPLFSAFFDVPCFQCMSACHSKQLRSA